MITEKEFEEEIYKVKKVLLECLDLNKVHKATAMIVIVQILTDVLDEFGVKQDIIDDIIKRNTDAVNSILIKLYGKGADK